MSKIKVSGKNGYIMIFKKLNKEKWVLFKENEFGLFDKLFIGYIRITENGRFINVNKSASDLLGFKNEIEIKGCKLSDFFINKEDKNNFISEIISNGWMKNKIFEINKKNGSFAVVAISGVLISGESESDKNRFIDIIIEDISEQKKIYEEKENLISELQTSLLFLGQPIKNLCREIIKCGMHNSIRKTAEYMKKHQSGAVLLTTEKGECAGIVTDYDFRERVVAAGLDSELPSFKIMSAPVESINDGALIFEALLSMQEKKVNFLAVKDNTGEIINVISVETLINMFQHTSSFIINEIKNSADIESIALIRKRIPGMIKALIDSGSNAKNITAVVSKISDIITHKVITMAISELGEPPVKFSFLALGSEGREEQTLVTDQDNAIIYDDFSGKGMSDKQVEDYFEKLSVKICDALNFIGYDYCKGGIMAKNIKWRQPISVWKSYFRDWINKTEPEDLLDISIFFDFRCIYGEKKITDELRNSINESISKKPFFFYLLGYNILLNKPPIGFFGNIVLDSSGTHPDTFNIKSAINHIIDFTRLYALQNNIYQSNTLSRLKDLFAKNVILKSTYNELFQSYNFLMLLRFKHQCRLLAENKNPDNYINPSELTHIEQVMIKKIFSQITGIQSKISFEFKISS